MSLMPRRMILSLFTLLVAFGLEHAQADETLWMSETIAGSGAESGGASQGAGADVAINQPFGVEVLRDGRVLVTEVGNHRIWQIDPRDGSCSVLVGTGTAGWTGDGGPGTEATLNEPYEVREDEAGNLYWVEMKNHIVRRWDAQTQLVSTIAGNGSAGFSGDGGPAIEAQFNQPHSLVLDQERKQIYVADIGNHRIRAIDLTNGQVRSLAGNGELKLPQEGQLAENQSVLGPRALAIDSGRLWVALREGHSLWTIDLSDGRWHHEAGTGTRGFQSFPIAALEAQFDGPKGIALTPDGRVAIVDTENHAIRIYDPATGMVTTAAGSGPDSRGFSEGKKPDEIRMNRPHGIAVDLQGRILVGDSENHRVRRLTPALP